MTLPAPFCECGSVDCGARMRHEDAFRLPDAAWAVAGSRGVGKGPNGEDLSAVFPAHFDQETMELIEAHEGWLAIVHRDGELSL